MRSRAWISSRARIFRRSRAILRRRRLCSTRSWRTTGTGAWRPSRNISFARLGSTRKFDDKEFLEGVKKLREEWKTVAKAIHDRWLTETAAEAEFDRGLDRPGAFRPH